VKYIVSLTFKVFRHLWRNIVWPIDWILCWAKFYVENVQHGSFSTNGIPFVSVARNATCILGDGLSINNGLKGNPIGCLQPCVFFVNSGATLQVGKNVGMSAVALVAHIQIIIGNNVKLGGGVCIYDTDFHSLNFKFRSNSIDDRTNKVCRPVYIGDNAFVGAHTTILKGVSIGENSIVGACSVVTKSIPANEIWAGNPAHFIKFITVDESV
jgi:acetyltransferase-like isoleucine patch superfamily enzyme